MTDSDNNDAAGAMTRQDMGGQWTTTAETASAGVAAQARAEIEGHYFMALKRPRDWMQVRIEILKECQRPGFAESARYRKPAGRGNVVEGFSIRFAEAALRCMRNVAPKMQVIYDDAQKRVLRISVTDIENNLPYASEITVNKTVERLSLKPGQQALSQRTNSTGRTTFLVEATESDIATKEAAQVSKALRTLALRLLPGDIQDECKEQIDKTMNDNAAKDPDHERKRLVDAFAGVGVEPRALEEYLGHSVAQTVPAEIVELRRVYAAIKSGEATWSDVLAAKLPSPDDAEKKGSVRDKVRQAAEAAKDGEAAVETDSEGAENV